MTREAIKFFKNLISETERVLKDRPEMLREVETVLPYYRMAIEALEKQIPKKPNLEGDGYADGGLVYDTWICPHCGLRYEVDYDDYAHCPNCGQAIDRSEE